MTDPFKPKFHAYSDGNLAEENTSTDVYRASGKLLDWLAENVTDRTIGESVLCTVLMYCAQLASDRDKQSYVDCFEMMAKAVRDSLPDCRTSPEHTISFRFDSLLNPENPEEAVYVMQTSINGKKYFAGLPKGAKSDLKGQLRLCRAMIKEIVQKATADL
jgi:hypothetical protein